MLYPFRTLFGMDCQKFSSAPLKKLYSWRPKSPAQDDSAKVRRLVNKVKVLTHSGHSIVEVMAIAIQRCILPLQSRVTPLWNYNREDEASRYK